MDIILKDVSLKSLSVIQGCLESRRSFLRSTIERVSKDMRSPSCDISDSCLKDALDESTNELVIVNDLLFQIG